jgi:hypothetical protein
MASAWRSKPTIGRSSSVAPCRISPWRGCSEARARRNGGRLTPVPSTGDRMLAVRSSKSDGAGLGTRRRRFDLDRLRPDQGQGTGRSAASSCGLFGRVYREHWLGHCLPITSRVRPFPTSVVIPPGLPISGEILISHIRSIDRMARPIRYAGVAVVGSRTTRPRELNTFITI